MSWLLISSNSSNENVIFHGGNVSASFGNIPSNSKSIFLVDNGLTDFFPNISKPGGPSKSSAVISGNRSRGNNDMKQN
jgi:hypothetical protein